jgi:UDP-glucose 4-epimerase
MKRTLITGGAGFIGGHLVRRLLDRGEVVVALDDLSTGSRDNVPAVGEHDRFRLVVGDVRDRRVVDDLVRECDVVVHLAARIGLKLVIGSPLRTMEVNADGTESVLAAASRYGKRTLVASTSEVYGLATKIPSSESDPISFGSPEKGRWSYACSKVFDEFYALALHRERGLPATVVRLFNTVGPKQSAHYGMVIPRFVRQALAGEPLTVYGDGTQTRSFCYVGDVVDALLEIVDRDETAGKVYNVGNPSEITIVDLAKQVIELTESTSPIEYVPFDVAYSAGFEEIRRRVPDIARARADFGFNPTTTLDAILRDVIDSVRSRKPVAR